MSHFFTVVLLPETTPQSAIGEFLDKMLAPFDERKKTPPYEQSCWCIGAVARRFAHDYANKADMPIESYRDAYWNLPGSVRETWENFTKEWQEAYTSAETHHELFDKPDPECDDCHGTGTRMSTYNPLSKWDWWRIGGRWDGAVQGAERESGDNGFNFEDGHEKLQHNAIHVAKMKDGYVSCFAVLTPDGEWIERGKMGWWGCVANDTDDDVWQEQLKTIFAKYKDCIAVGCDLHI